MEIIKKNVLPPLASLYLARLRQDPRLLIEFVDTVEPPIPKDRKWVMMISTQIGCPVGCGFCDAGSLGYLGNLSAEEMLDQIRYIVSSNRNLPLSRHPKIKVHFARMGEPSLNPQVLDALRFIGSSLRAPGLIPSLSTVAPKSPVTDAFFEELIRVKDAYFPGGKFQLQFSIHSTDEAERRRIVPVKKWSLKEISDYGRRFVAPGDRKVTLNFAAPPKAALDAKAVSKIFPADIFLIKITPVNPTVTADGNSQTRLWLDPPSDISRFSKALKNLGFQVILSPSLPEEISAATSCGQLWSDSLKEQTITLSKSREKEACCYVTADTLASKTQAWMREIAPYARPAFPLSVDPTTALLIMDMQEFFLNPRSPAYFPQARAILGNVKRLELAFRKSGNPVIFAMHAHEDVSKDGGLMSLWWRKVCMAATPESRISRALEPKDGEIFRKCRYSAFSNPNLEETLRQKGVQKLIIAGLATNLCVESTIRDAFDLGFKPFVIADASCAHTEDLHVGSLKSLSQGFCGVHLTEEVLSASTL